MDDDLYETLTHFPHFFLHILLGVTLQQHLFLAERNVCLEGRPERQFLGSALS
ncbi:hypothetical protein [Pantoea rodasii]|uniref:hypothetical protein n=1 Tax=Pantoea rodasii TaxID=1076549 RepID=UPI0012FD0FAF|nr:hypothetical protein [Pantoea rodasii]